MNVSKHHEREASCRFTCTVDIPALLFVIIIIIIIVKKDWQCKAGRWRLTSYQSEGPSPTLPTYRGKEEKGKIVEDKKGDSNQANKKALDLSCSANHFQINPA